MPTRRSLLACFAALALPAPASAQSKQPQPAADERVAMLNEIYAKALKKNAGGDLINAPKVRAKYLSAAFAALWTKAEAAAPKGDIGPIDFDPITNSQDPENKSFAVKTEKQDDKAATLTVTLKGRKRDKPSDDVIRYEFVRENDHWRIDDIASTADGDPWSVRSLLTESLKN